MINFIVNALKIIFLLGFLIFIHEGGHFCVAKLCKIKVKEFAIGFGKIIWQKQGKETKYTLRLIPLGGFCSMEGEDEESDDDRAFSKASVWKRIAIVLAGPIVNIVFGLIVYYILVASVGIQFANPIDDTIINRLTYSGKATGEFIIAILDSVKTLFTVGTSVDQMVGIVGISEIVVKTAGIANYINLMALISISLGITNLLPIPALDGGKILILIIEIIRRKQMKIETEAKIQMIGFSILLALSLIVTYNDIIRIKERVLQMKKRNRKTKVTRNQKGISLIALTTTILVLAIVTSIVIYNAKDVIEVREYKKLESDIEVLENKVNMYYLNYKKIPVLEKDSFPVIYNGDMEFLGQKRENDNDNYYILNLRLIDGITLNFGGGFYNIKNTDNNITDRNNNVITDIYIINEQSHRIYYVQGIQVDETIYYTIGTDANVPMINEEIE